jgi:vitamin B12 transporter
MDSEDEATGRPLARRPTNRASLQVWFQPVARLSGVVSLVSVSDRIDSDGTNMDDYERVDLAMEYAATRHLTPYVRLENLLDEDYEEVSGFTTPGFSGVGGLRATW